MKREMERLPGMLCGNLVYVLCFVELWLADMVHANFSYTRKASVTGYNYSAELAGNSCKTHCMLYPGSIKALLHNTACALGPKYPSSLNSAS